MGMLPALAGLVVLSILFSASRPFFLTKGNIANLMTQTAALMMLAIALTFVIMLAEIDLSAGVTGGLGMAIFILLVNVSGLELDPGAGRRLRRRRRDRHVHRLLRRRMGIPSFVVTLGLFLGFQGLILVLLGDAGAYRIEEPRCWPS